MLFRSDLQKVYSKMAEVDKARQSDRTAINEQIKILAEKVAELQARPPVTIREVPTPIPPRNNTRVPDKTSETSTEKDSGENSVPDNPGGYYKHKVKQGEYLSTIIAAYNAKLKEEHPNKRPITLDAVKKANPKLNPNNVPIGKEILIPVPPDK